jgi:ABC-type ATPase with predicted acetyltransferase domain
MTTYIINKSFQTRVARSERVLEMAEAFGLGLEDREFTIFNDLHLDVNQGDVVFITGQSGSGKSQLLRELTRQMRESGLKVADIDQVQFEDKALIDQIGSSLHDAVELLSRAGINDAYLAVRTPHELSDGQRYRLKLAKLMETDADVLVADEWGAVLDRITAKVISFNAAKWARAKGKTLIVATTHLDIEDELAPDLRIEKRFQERVLITTLKDKVDER